MTPSDDGLLTLRASVFYEPVAASSCREFEFEFAKCVKLFKDCVDLFGEGSW